MFAAGKTAAVSGAAPDGQFNYVTMLLHGDGTNGAQNNTFLDSSTNNFSITRNGNTTQGSFSPYGSGWSNYFSGSTDYLGLGTSTNLALGAGDFTIEVWLSVTAYNASTSNIFEWRSAGGTPSNIPTLYLSASGVPIFYASVGSGALITGSSAVALNTWTHLAIVRSGSTVTMYLNGTSVGSATNSANLGTQSFYINDPQGTYRHNGYFSNVRMVKGTAVYTSAFTPSTTPLTAITNTQLLTCQSNRFIDNSTNAFAITVNGTPSVQRFNPFGTSTAYSTSVIGGSGYFDGNDYLNTPSSSQFTASGDFTVSCWFYLQSFSNSYYVVGGNWDGGVSDEWLIQIANDGSIRFLTTAGTSFSSTGVVKLNQWTYFTATRSGTTVTVKLNGTTVSTYTKSDTLGASSKTIYIGQQSGNNWPFNGYISDFRLLSGSAITTIPTAPVSSTSTGLLLSFTNGAIFDNAMMNNLETVGNAQISTSVVKYGTGSLAFDGTGDRLVSPPTYLFDLAGDFTIECWVNFNSIAGTYTGIASYADSSGWYGWQLIKNNSNIQFQFLSASAGVGTVTSSSTVTTGVWYHIAVVRSGSTITLYIDGTSRGTSTSSVSYSSANSFFRVGDERTLSYPLDGYVDDLRITKGYARYTANFSVPTGAFPNIGPV